MPSAEERQASRLLDIIDRLEPKLRKAFLAAVASMTDATRLSAIIDALDRGDTRVALAAIPVERVGMASLSGGFLVDWRDGFAAAGSVAAAAIAIPHLGAPGVPRTAPKLFTFEVLNPRSLRFLEAHGAELVTEITDSTRQALRDTLTLMLRKGWDTRTTAKALKGQIGLNSRLATAVTNYRDGLMEAGEQSDAAVERLTAAYADRLLTYRATLIARTEAKAAAMAGQSASVQDAVDRRLLTRSVAAFVWMTAEDPTVCLSCDPMDGQTRTLEQLAAGDLFVNGDGELVESPAEQHPSCRCTRALLPTGVAQRAAA